MNAVTVLGVITIVAMAACTITAYACIKVSGDCSRAEEEAYGEITKGQR